MSISEYVGKTLIAWHYYNENYMGEYGTSANRRSYVYPRIIKNKDTEFTMIQDCENEFPKKGRVEVRLTADLTAEDLYAEVGEIVEIRMNVEPECNMASNNYYSLRFNRNLGKERTEIWIEKFSGRGFTQIISLTSDWERAKREHRVYYSGDIYTNEIVFEYKNKYYGPFEYDKKEDFLVLNAKRENSYFISEYLPEELDQNIYIVDNPETNDNIRLINKKAIGSPLDRDIKIDWIDSDKLVEFLCNILKKQKLNTKDEIRRFKENIGKLIEENQEIYLDEYRKKSISELLLLPDKRDNLVQMIVHTVLDDEELNKEITQTICENHFEYIEKNSTELKKYKEEIANLTLQRDDIKKQIEAAKDNLNNLAEKARLEQGEQIEKIKGEIKELEEKKKYLEHNIKDLLATIEEVNDIKDLEEKKEKLKKESERAETERELREDDLRKTKAKQEDLNSKLKKIVENFNDETKIVVDKLDKAFLNKVLKEISGEENSDIQRFDTKLFYEKSLEGEEIIEIVREYLNDKANRNVSYNDVVNYLTCIGQGFITTFAGHPGTGKTSLCSLIAKALGLAREDENRRFVEIAVERGWTSHKDFIGYYNPLTKQLEKSNIEVFEAFNTLNQEITEEVTAPMFILLDEANLSPIEHYWAAFIKNCDFDSATERCITLGGNLKWNLSPNLRFLATVNFDHTTEELSPRFLDRSWIVMLEPVQIDEEILAQEPMLNAEKVVSFNDFINAFGKSNEIEIDDNILTKWKNIRNIFKENDMMIMPRNVRMVLEYCKVACKYMKRDTPETRFAPLDYAIAQKILPTINGNGENLYSLFSQLKEECGESNMPICSKIINRIQKKADDNMGYYQFFTM